MGAGSEGERDGGGGGSVGTDRGCKTRGTAGKAGLGGELGWGALAIAGAGTWEDAIGKVPGAESGKEPGEVGRIAVASDVPVDGITTTDGRAAIAEGVAGIETLTPLS